MEESKESIQNSESIVLEVKSTTTEGVIPKDVNPTNIFKKKDVENHKKEIDRIIFPQYNEEVDYIYTYNKEDRSLLGWSINVKENGKQQSDVCFEIPEYIKLTASENSKYNKYTLYKNFLLLGSLTSCVVSSVCNNMWYDVYLIDFNKDNKIEDNKYEANEFGFLPNGDMILVKLDKDDDFCDKLRIYTISKYPFENNKHANTPQIHNIEIPGGVIDFRQFLYQSKLFFFHEYGLIQWDLSNMSVEMEYSYLFDYICDLDRPLNLVINKNQTILALNACSKVDIFSMESGMWISRYG